MSGQAVVGCPCPLGRMTVLPDERAVHIWSDTFALYGSGATVEDAAADLAAELCDYAAAWHARLNSAPNHRHLACQVQSVERLAAAGQLARTVREACGTADPDACGGRSMPHEGEPQDSQGASQPW